MTDAISVMTFNLRLDTGAPAGDPDSWIDREPLVGELLRTERPALLGMQEPLFEQLDVISASLPEHRVVGGGVLGGSRGCHSAIAYDSGRFRLTGWDQQWLSDSPLSIGSTSWGNDAIRVFVRCDFVELASGRPLTMINTHLDHLIEEARVKGAEQIGRAAAEIDHPVIITGDFNCPAVESAAWQVLTDDGLQDSWLTAKEHGSPQSATFTGYQELQPDGPRIDWILVSPDISVASTKINTWTRDGRWPSDHCPVQAEIVLPS
jgi:endonuclease/exonuclease/phosphatase family metal-dependent hydrolase